MTMLRNVQVRLTGAWSLPDTLPLNEEILWASAGVTKSTGKLLASRKPGVGRQLPWKGDDCLELTRKRKCGQADACCL